MTNMSYCRFHNTLLDLRDCKDALEDMLDHGGEVQGFKEYAERWRELQRIKDHTEDQEEEFEELHERLEEIREDIHPLSDEEYRCAVELLDLCEEIGESFCEESLLKDSDFEIYEGEHED